MPYEQYEDSVRLEKRKQAKQNQTSPYCDFIYYESSRTPGVMLAARIVKPEKPSYILAGTHGWHMSIPAFKPMEEPQQGNHYLRVDVDMRGRAHSEGAPDCNGWELYDVIDAIQYAREHYAEYILDPDIVYFESGSGGGGNAMAIACKFPDYFAAVTALCGISDYALWYDNDEIGEFRDEMDVWIGCAPKDNPMAFRSRSGLDLIGNLTSPVYLAHGETDIRVPADHSRLYAAKAAEIGKDDLITYYELPGVGTRDHWGNATGEMLDKVRSESELNRARHRRPVELPERGRLTVGGYLFTRRFSVVLDSLDKVAVLEYDLAAGKFELTCETGCTYTITAGGETVSGTAAAAS
ncbi:alpha/beta hydrolase family protein [Paenibacillus oceani]|uniref:Prolyl oligopeptidase family serine peptidase n=1 Tax=Paenibacillus oceani TaxID=2772510 RepID=A0A927H188_9BACL|nr:prolyl oligopeptidase family serine peptidase [Paenibacillus oceani]MBD2863239.1 prolyl oligopeptidase family serine peptidase [Paenibacillus oceani]